VVADRSASAIIQDRTFERPPIQQRKVGAAVPEDLLAVMTGREPDAHGWIENI
jgi:hypothetical protein